MGKFIYGAMASSVEIEDRTLAHLRLAMVNKLRRSEGFMLELDMGDGSGRRSFWIQQSVPLQFHFYGSRLPRINRAWVDELMLAASSPTGLTVIPEPPESRQQVEPPVTG